MGFLKDQDRIARSLHLVESIKNRMLFLLATLYGSLSTGKEGLVREALSELIFNAYLLGKRMGINYASMDRTMESKAREYLQKEDEAEKYFGDITDFLNYQQTHKK